MDPKILFNSDYRSAVVPLIQKARQSIRIFMYDWRWYVDGFSNDVSLINSALISASRRGVKVQVIANSNDVPKDVLTLNFAVKSWTKTKSMHAKCIVIDSDTIILGSHNLTQNAMGLNLEISCVVLSEPSAGLLIKYFDSIWSS